MHRVVRQGVPLTLSCARGKLDGRSAKPIAEFSLPLPQPALARACEGCRSSRCFQHGICSIGFRICPPASTVSPEALTRALGLAEAGPRQAQRPGGPWWLPACPAAAPRRPIRPSRKGAPAEGAPAASDSLFPKCGNVPARGTGPGQISPEFSLYCPIAARWRNFCNVFDATCDTFFTDLPLTPPKPPPNVRRNAMERISDALASYRRRGLAHGPVTV